MKIKKLLFLLCAVCALAWAISYDDVYNIIYKQSKEILGLSNDEARVVAKDTAKTFVYFRNKGYDDYKALFYAQAYATMTKNLRLQGWSEKEAEYYASMLADNTAYAQEKLGYSKMKAALYAGYFAYAKAKFGFDDNKARAFGKAAAYAQLELGYDEDKSKAYALNKSK